VLFVLQLLLYAFHEFTEAGALPIDNAYWHLATEEWAEGEYANLISLALILIPLAWLGYASLRRGPPPSSTALASRPSGKPAMHRSKRRKTAWPGFTDSGSSARRSNCGDAVGADDGLRPGTAAGRSNAPEVVVPAQGERAGGPVDGYRATRSSTFTKTDTPLREVPASITVVPADVMKDQGMQSMSDVFRYVPGATWHQGEGNRDQVVIRGNSTTADFYVDGVRDDAQVFRDLYNLERVEVLKGRRA
jgi:hypothetical protein